MITNIKRAECDFCENYELFESGDMPDGWAIISTNAESTMLCPRCFNDMLGRPMMVGEGSCENCECSRSDRHPHENSKDAEVINALIHLFSDLGLFSERK